MDFVRFVWNQLLGDIPNLELAFKHLLFYIIARLLGEIDHLKLSRRLIHMLFDSRYAAALNAFARDCQYISEHFLISHAVVNIDLISKKGVFTCSPTTSLI